MRSECSSRRTDYRSAQLLAAPTRPAAAYLHAGPSEWADDMTLRAELAARMNDFAAALKQ